MAFIKINVFCSFTVSTLEKGSASPLICRVIQKPTPTIFCSFLEVSLQLEHELQQISPRLMLYVVFSQDANERN